MSEVLSQFRVPATLAAPAEARRRLRADLTRGLSEIDLDGIELVASELVTNSVRHSGAAPGSPISVRVTATDERARLEVIDQGPGFEPGLPRPRSLADGGGGLGLVLLARSSLDWGAVAEDGSCVWGEFPRTRLQEGAV